MANIPWVDPPRDDDQPIENLKRALTNWKGTPYMPGQCLPGVGVDCLRFVAAMGCAMEDREMIKTNQLPRDTAFHRPDLARKAIRQLMLQFPKWGRITVPMALHPGDLVVVGPKGIPSHGMIVGPWQPELFHASSIGVENSAWDLTGPRELNSVYRWIF